MYVSFLNRIRKEKVITKYNRFDMTHYMGYMDIFSEHHSLILYRHFAVTYSM